MTLNLQMILICLIKIFKIFYLKKLYDNLIIKNNLSILY